MPELPEVEVLVRALTRRVGGAMVRAFERGPQARGGLTPASRWVGREIRAATRAGKWVVFEFADAAGRAGIHLRMTGRLVLDVGDEPFLCRWDLGDGRNLALIDQRRLAEVRWVAADAEAPWATAAPDPLAAGFGGKSLRVALRRRSIPVKAALLDPAVVSGIGNIYACEALHRARIHPRTPADRIGPVRCERLAAALRDAVADAVARGERILRRRAAGPDGFELLFYYRDGRPTPDPWRRVYDRAGDPCATCAATIRRIVISGRGTWYCPRCQRR